MTAGHASAGDPILPPVVVIAGPTAAGKSRLALGLADAFAGTVINADSMQVYRELRVLTARPSPADEAEVPHRLYGILPGAERCSAGRWRALAMAAINEAWAAGRLPLVVGGTGFYMKVLREGLSPIPHVPAELRAEARRLHAHIGPERFRDAVAAIDPDTAARLPAGDTQRLIRAWEVHAATGIPLSRWHRQAPAEKPSPARFATIVVAPHREHLNAAIEARFRRMIEAGAIDEVRRLLALDLDPSLPVMKAAGVRELAAFLQGTLTLDAACNAATRATRAIAKRQMTWLRHQVAADLTLTAQHSETLTQGIFAFIRRFLLTRGE